MSQSPAERLRADTRLLHAEVERAGIMPRLLRGELGRAGYCALLRNLHEIYRLLEDALRRNASLPQLAPVVLPALFRAEALGEDLGALHGPGWPHLPLVPATQAYAARLRDVERDAAALLLAHAYVRYLGDLSGGQIVRRIVGASLGLADGAGLRFYDFGDGPRRQRLADDLRRGIDSACAPAALEPLVAEAQLAFRLHARLFEQLAA
jgi:heme oxygenase